MRRQSAQDHLVEGAHPLANAPVPGADRAFQKGFRRVGHHQLGVEHLEHAETMAHRTRPQVAVEGEMLGGQRGQREAGLRVAVVGGIGRFLPVIRVRGPGRLVQHDELAFAPAQRGFDRIRESRADALAQDEPIHHGLDGMLLRLGEPHGFRAAVEFDDLAVQPHAHEAFALHFFEYVAELARLPPDDRREQDQPGIRLQGEDLVDDGLGRLAAQGAAGGGIVRLADAGVEQAQVVVDLGGGGDGRARVAGPGALFERDGGGQPFDEVHVGLLQLVEELPGVGGKALDVAAAALGVEGVEGEAAFARTARPREHDQLAARERQAEILQIMLARAADSDSLLGHSEIAFAPPDFDTTKDIQQSTPRLPKPMNSSSFPEVPAATAAAHNGDSIMVSRAELMELHNKFRAVKHSACNALAVIMALSEMAERNPTYVEKLTKTVLSKSPQMVTELRTFDDEFRALLKSQPD